MDYLVVFIQYNHRPGAETGKGAVLDGDAVVLLEAVVPEGGEGFDVFQAFGTAEAGGREGQIGGDDEYHGVVQAAGFFVELPGRRGADAGIDARDDVQDLAFAGPVVEFDFFQPAVGERKGRRVVACLWKFAAQFNGIAVQVNAAHSLCSSVSGLEC